MVEKNLNIYDYTNYRSYLKDYYQVQKKINRAFSYRYFANKAELNSSGFYKNVVEGARKLNRSQILKFAKAMKLKKPETEYFENLVYFNDGKSMEEKTLYFERIMSIRKLDGYIVDAAQYEFYSKWYYSAVRELIGIMEFKNDYASLALKLNPSIRTDQAEKAIKILEELKLIQKNKKGIYELKNNVITTGPEITSLQVANYQMKTIELAKESIDRHPAENRDVSTLTLSISEEAFKAMKEEIVAFRSKLLKLEQKFGNADRVYQMNLQFFPLSKFQEDRNGQ